MQKKINEIYTIRLNAVDRDGNTRYEYLRQQVKDAARPRYYRDVMATMKKTKSEKNGKRKGSSDQKEIAAQNSSSSIPLVSASQSAQENRAELTSKEILGVTGSKRCTSKQTVTRVGACADVSAQATDIPLRVVQCLAKWATRSNPRTKS